MREIISIQIGGCGNIIGESWWKMCREGMNEIYNRESLDGKHIPRAILVDEDPEILNEIREGGVNFCADNYICGNNNNIINGYTHHGNWGRSYKQKDVSNEVEETIRKELEICESFQGFHIYHGIGGGTGSGLGTLIIDQLHDQYLNKIISTFSIFPTQEDSPFLLYNSILAAHHLIENTNHNLIFDLSALYAICFKLREFPSYMDIDYIVTTAIYYYTSIFTYINTLGDSEMDLVKLNMNLVPYPPLHFFLLSLLPIPSRYYTQQYSMDYTFLNIIQELADQTNYLSQITPLKHNSCLGAMIVLRTNTNIEYPIDISIERSILDLRATISPNDQDLFADNIKYLIYENEVNNGLSGCFIGNSTCIRGVLNRISEEFNAVFTRKAFLHYYIQEGLEEMDFEEADSNVRESAFSYQEYEERFVND